MSERLKLPLSRRQVLSLAGVSLFLAGCSRHRRIAAFITKPTPTPTEVVPSATPTDVPPYTAAPENSGLTGQALPVPDNFVEPTPDTEVSGHAESPPISGTHVREVNRIIYIDVSELREGECQPPDEIPQDLARAIVKHFGTGIEAAEAATVAWSENGGFDPHASPTNKDGSRDLGYFQINSANFPSVAAELGLSNIEQLYEADNNVAAARIIYGWGDNSWRHWYGPNRVGCAVHQ
jgi:hypothetical protein